MEDPRGMIFCKKCNDNTSNTDTSAQVLCGVCGQAKTPYQGRGVPINLI